MNKRDLQLQNTACVTILNMEYISHHLGKIICNSSWLFHIKKPQKSMFMMLVAFCVYSVWCKITCSFMSGPMISFWIFINQTNIYKKFQSWYKGLQRLPKWNENNYFLLVTHSFIIQLSLRVVKVFVFSLCVPQSLLLSTQIFISSHPIIHL